MVGKRPYLEANDRISNLPADLVLLYPRVGQLYPNVQICNQCSKCLGSNRLLTLEEGVVSSLDEGVEVVD